MSFGVSLGNATNSLTDTSARHTCVYRICTDMYNSLVDPNDVINNKHDYKTVRFEIALSIGRVFHLDLGISPIMCRKGPAPVITNIAPFTASHARDQNLMAWYVKWYDCRTLDELLRHRQTTCIVKGQSYYPSELNFAGFVLSDAQGHPMNGDTAVTLFIGGMITIKNGRFPILSGDQVQWYFEEEANAGVFNEDGHRKPRSVTAGNATLLTADAELLDPQAQKIRDHSYGERAKTKRIVYVKPYRQGVTGEGATLLDARRVFGIATGDAGPFELVDLKISRQSL
jgi:hypothetical protein